MSATRRPTPWNRSSIHDTQLVGALPPVHALEQLSVLSPTGSWDARAADAQDSFARLASALLQAPKAYVTLVSGPEENTPGAVMLDQPGAPDQLAPINASICPFQVSTSSPLLIHDSQPHQLTAGKPSVVNGTIAAHAGVPVLSAGGHVLGFLCVADRRPREWTDGQLTLLTELAGLIGRDLQHRMSMREMRAHERLATELGAEVTTLLQATAGLVDAAEQLQDPRLQGYAARTRTRSQAVGTLASQLQKTARQEQPPTCSPKEVDLCRAVEHAVDRTVRGLRNPDLDMHRDLLPSPLLIRCDPAWLERALTDLFVSADHHTLVGEALHVGVARAGLNNAVLTLKAIGTQIPAAELASIVRRFHAATSATPLREDARAAVRMRSGGVEARSGSVTGLSSRSGLSFRAQWACVDPDASLAAADIGSDVIDLR